MTLLDFQLVLGRHNIRPPHFASKVSYSASPQASAKCPRGAPCCDATLAMLFVLKTAQILFWILNTLCVDNPRRFKAYAPIGTIFALSRLAIAWAMSSTDG